MGKSVSIWHSLRKFRSEAAHLFALGENHPSRVPDGLFTDD